MEDKTMKMTNTNGLLVFQEVQNPAVVYGCDFSGVSIVGRSAETCNIIINNPTVSRNHFKVYQQGTACMIEDLNSTHHTFVNGTQIAVPTPIKVGDVISLGALQLKVVQMELSYDKMAEIPMNNPAVTPAAQQGFAPEPGFAPEEPVYQPEPNFNDAPVYQPEPNYNNGPAYQPEPNYNNGPVYQPEQVKEQGGAGMAIASMVLGIVALVLSCCFYYVSLPCALIGLILGIIAVKKNTKGKGMGIAGIVCSVISLIPAILTIVLGASLMGMVSSM